MKGRYVSMDLSILVVVMLAAVCIVGLILGFCKYGSRTIFKIILAALITILAGWVGMVIGLEYLGGYPEFGCVIAIAVMGMFIMMVNNRNQPRS